MRKKFFFILGAIIISLGFAAIFLSNNLGRLQANISGVENQTVEYRNLPGLAHWLEEGNGREFYNSTYSTIIYTKDTEFYVNSSDDTGVTYVTGVVVDDKVTPHITLKSVGQKAQIIIKNCGIDSSNNIMDAVLEVTVTDMWSPTAEQIAKGKESSVRLSISALKYPAGGQAMPEFSDSDSDEDEIIREPLSYNMPMQFNLHANWATARIDVKYYKHIELKERVDDYYTTPKSGSQANRALAHAKVATTRSTVNTEINKINALFSDLDIVPKDKQSQWNAEDKLFQGKEGLRPLSSGYTRIYYKTDATALTYTHRFSDGTSETVTHKQILKKASSNVEGYEGIYVDGIVSEVKTDSTTGKTYNEYEPTFSIYHRNANTGESENKNVNGIWYANSAVFLAKDFEDGTYSFEYGGDGAGILFSFISFGEYDPPAPIKQVLSTGSDPQPVNKVKPNETFVFEVSQYIPNNYYTNELDLSQIYEDFSRGKLITELVFTDQIDDRLTIDEANIKVEDINGIDLTSKFAITVENNLVTATAIDMEYFQSYSAYNNTMKLKIPVRYNGTVTQETTIPNRGYVTVKLGEYVATPVPTNEVTVTVGPIKLIYDCTTNGGQPKFNPTEYYMSAGQAADLSYKCAKTDNKFIGWSETPDGEIISSFTMPDHDAILYGRYEPYTCDMTISSDVYKIDKEKKIIYVEQNDTVETIKKNIKAVETITVTETEVTVTCKNQKDIYRIERYWKPQTGNKVVKYGLIIGCLLGAIVILIIITNISKKDNDTKKSKK